MNPVRAMYNRFFNYDDASSFVNTIRRRRTRRLISLLREVDSNVPIRVLDVGGGYGYWKMTELLDHARYHITLVNLSVVRLPEGIKGFTSIAGDGTKLLCGDKEFDVVFSNSVIEHVPSREQQVLMAREVQRVGKRYFIQTPSKWFPLEPHSHIPLFQFFPKQLRALVIFLFNVKWFPARPSYRECMDVAESIHMLSYPEFKLLFPEAQIRKERLFGLVKSYVAEYGWERDHLPQRKNGAQ